MKPVCERLICAGSLRRLRPMVGDVEILYVPRTERRPNPQDMFSEVDANLVDEVIADFERAGILGRRLNVKGSEVFGAKNKLMVHNATGLPVDLFSATLENWWNYLVCRTGPAESNTRICMAAQARGWKWNPYGVGFTRLRGLATTSNHLQVPMSEHAVSSEREVFEFVGLPYFEPKDRR